MRLRIRPIPRGPARNGPTIDISSVLNTSAHHQESRARSPLISPTVPQRRTFALPSTQPCPGSTVSPAIGRYPRSSRLAPSLPQPISHSLEGRSRRALTLPGRTWKARV